MLKTYVILTISSEIVFKNNDYVECLFLGRTDSFISGVTFSKNCFRKKFVGVLPFFNRFLMGLSPVEYQIATGRLPAEPNRSTQTGLLFFNRFHPCIKNIYSFYQKRRIMYRSHKSLRTKFRSKVSKIAEANLKLSSDRLLVHYIDVSRVRMILNRHFL